MNIKAFTRVYIGIISLLLCTPLFLLSNHTITSTNTKETSKQDPCNDLTPITPLEYETLMPAKADKNKLPPLQPWLMEESFKKAPELVHGLVEYLKSLPRCSKVPSFHHLLFVGPPGTGKTTLAYSIAYKLNWKIVYMPATNFLGQFRNQTVVNINKFFKEITEDFNKKVIIIDEIHKLFEGYENDKNDHSETAAAFWLMLDLLEKMYPNILIVGTANDASKLPPEIKSRFLGKIISMSTPTKSECIKAFKDSVFNDETVILDPSVTDKVISQLFSSNDNLSLRDIQSLIDTAKIFCYAQKKSYYGYTVLELDKNHLEKAALHLQLDRNCIEPSYLEVLYPRAKKWGVILSLTINAIIISRMAKDMTKSMLLTLCSIADCISID